MHGTVSYVLVQKKKNYKVSTLHVQIHTWCVYVVHMCIWVMMFTCHSMLISSKDSLKYSDFFLSRWDSITWLFFCNHIRLASLWTSIEPPCFSPISLKTHWDSSSVGMYDMTVFTLVWVLGIQIKRPLCRKHFYPLNCLSRLRQFLTENQAVPV